MSRRASGMHGPSTLLRRVWDAVVREFTPAPMPRSRPSEEQLAAGHLAVGTIDDAIEDDPGVDVQGPDTLVISAELPGGGVLHRTISCPLSTPGSGRRLIGQAVAFRHTTLELDFVNDVLIVRWPDEVRKALKPYVPGSLRERFWIFLASCSTVIAVGGFLLAWVMFIGVVFTGSEMFSGLPSWFHPGLTLAGSAAAGILGLFAFGFCNSRATATRSRAGRRRRPREVNPR